MEQLLLHDYRLDLLEIGAAGQLYLHGKLAEVLPAEATGVYELANPVQADGAVVFDDKRNAAREDAIVSKLLKAGPIGVIVLGGAHDLTVNIDRVSKGTCEVVTVTTEAYRKVSN